MSLWDCLPRDVRHLILQREYRRVHAIVMRQLWRQTWHVRQVLNKQATNREWCKINCPSYYLDKVRGTYGRFHMYHTQYQRDGDAWILCYPRNKTPS